MRAPNTKVIIALLVVALLITIGVVVYERWQNYWWKDEVSMLAFGYGGTSAELDFREGKIRLFIFSGERKDNIYSGTNDGPFQIWFSQYDSDRSWRYGRERFVDGYNNHMEFMQSRAPQAVNRTNSPPNNARGCVKTPARRES
jgi:hypothetical protein